MYDLAGATYPADATPLEGKSLRPAFANHPIGETPLLGKEGNHAVRDGNWKLVAKHNQPSDSTNVERPHRGCHDLSPNYPDVVKTLKAKYKAYAARANVLPSAGGAEEVTAERLAMRKVSLPLLVRLPPPLWGRVGVGGSGISQEIPSLVESMGRAYHESSRTLAIPLAYKKGESSVETFPDELGVRLETPSSSLHPWGSLHQASLRRADRPNLPRKGFLLL